MKRAPRNRAGNPAPVAETKASVRTNVARVWQRAVGSMRHSKAETLKGSADAKAAKAHAVTLALASSYPSTVDSTSAGRIIETPIQWALDVPSATPSESGVYANALKLENEGEDLAETLDAVTLIVYGWSNVEPGTLAWVFPTVRAALAAARAMRNAIGWAILSGDHEAAAGSAFDLSAARDRGEILVEQPV